MVPMNIIQNDNAGSYVYVARSKGEYHAAYKQIIEIGNSYNGVAEVVKGLSEGDRIISAGFQELVDGQYVRF
jgi:multidrug efflux pump subunit AcrA (membrane-fusion protein)